MYNTHRALTFENLCSDAMLALVDGKKSEKYSIY